MLCLVTYFYKRGVPMRLSRSLASCLSISPFSLASSPLSKCYSIALWQHSSYHSWDMKIRFKKRVKKLDMEVTWENSLLGIFQDFLGRKVIFRQVNKVIGTYQVSNDLQGMQRERELSTLLEWEEERVKLLCVSLKEKKVWRIFRIRDCMPPPLHSGQAKISCFLRKYFTDSFRM